MGDHLKKTKARCSTGFSFTEGYVTLHSSRSLHISCSSSANSSKNQTSRVLVDFAKLHAALDPLCVTKNSMLFFINLIAKYCKFGAKEA